LSETHGRLAPDTQAQGMGALLTQRISSLARKDVAAALRIDRGYTPAGRWRVTFADGSTAFAKVGTTPLTAEWLRAERRIYASIEAEFLPRFLGFQDHPEAPLLLLEDLSTAVWPPPWRPGDLERLLEALPRVAATRPARDVLADLERDRGRFAGWLNVERNPAPFLSLGLCSAEWLSMALPTLLLAQDLATLTGADLVHGDLRSDNLCFLPGRVVLVDWNGARRGNASFDLASLAPSLRLEAGPLPEELLPGESTLPAMICGYFAANAGLPGVPDAPHVRHIQLRQLRIALHWAARSLGLPPPDLPWARATGARLDADLAAGRLDEAGWHMATEAVIGDAYLATDDPRAQSGKSGDEAEWRWSRELALDALPARTSSATVLDVGCANGYLMESLHRWGEERGLRIEPYGLDISWRLAALARRRLPAVWAERVEVGNVLDWQPTRRFDLVHTALDYVPPARRKASIERVLRDIALPKGRVVLRAERVRPGEPDLVQQVESLGLSVGGVLERTHPTSKEVRRTVWLQA